MAARFMPLRIILCCLLLAASTMACGKPQDALAHHASPYLAMHAADQVQWRLWGKEAIAEARRTGKLLFVSSGNFSCYWCHVMQRENFLNPRIAALINRNFIPVLIDSELQPALDAQLSDFLTRTLGFAGWPLQVFITPDGYPLAGTTYAAPADFEPMLKEMADEWTRNGKTLAGQAREAALAQRPPLPKATDSLESWVGEAARTALIRQGLAAADGDAGGFGKQSKFPSAPQLHALLIAYHRSDDGHLKKFLLLTLDRMASGGLRDQLGGGFFRYTTDREWHDPHFEKTLYDNAQLAILYLQAAQVFDRPDYLRIGQETLDFMLRELTGPDGGMIASLAAVDDSMREGRYYLWSRSELERVLSPAELQVINRAWDIKRNLGRQDKFLPRRIATIAQIAALRGDQPDTVEQLLQAAQHKLLDTRNRRALPRDGKKIAGWNGLALAALAQGAQLPHGEKYRRAGQRLRDFLVNTQWNGKQLWRVHAGAQGAEGTLEDYALTAKGLLAWSQISHDPVDGRVAGQIIGEAWRRFHNDDTGWQLEERPLLPIETAAAALPDGALPSASATILAASLEWASATGNIELRKRTRAALNGSRPLFDDNPFTYASYAAVLAQAQSN